MNMPDLHDGYFEGLWIGPDKDVHIFLRELNGNRITLILREVNALSLSGIKEGNIIFDVVVRGPQDLTLDDIEHLHGVSKNSSKASDLLDLMVKRELKVLEINPSYGAQGLVSFRAFELVNSSYPD